MIIGGAEDKLRKRAILKDFVQASGGTRARIAVIPTASSLGDAVVEVYDALFRYGQEQYRDTVTEAAAHAEPGLGAIGEPAVAHLLEPLFHAARLPDNMLHPVSFVVAMSVVVYLHVVLGEMVPKNIAIAGPERTAILLVPPFLVFTNLMRPVIELFG